MHTDRGEQRWTHFSWCERVFIYYSSSQRWQWLDHGRDHGYGRSSPSWKERVQCKMTGATEWAERSSQTATCLRSPSQRAAEAPASSAHSCLSASQPSVQFNHNSAVHCPSCASPSWPRQSTSSQGSWVALRALTHKVWSCDEGSCFTLFYKVERPGVLRQMISLQMEGNGRSIFPQASQMHIWNIH